MNAPELMWAAQVAAVAAWTNDAPLVAFLGGPHVFEERVPEGVVVTRYVIVGEQTAVPLNAMATRGSRATMAGGAWTRGAPDRGDVVEIVRLMDAAVKAPLAVEGFGTVLLKNIMTIVLADPDDHELRHAPFRYRLNAFASA